MPKNPNDHAHFSKGCGLCALEQGVAGGKSATARPPTRRQPIQSSAAILATISTALTGGGSSPSPAIVFMAIGALLLGFYALYPRQQQSVPAPPKSNPKISNLISGQYFDGSNDLRVVSSIFAGTPSPVITKVDYKMQKLILIISNLSLPTLRVMRKNHAENSPFQEIRGPYIVVGMRTLVNIVSLYI